MRRNGLLARSSASVDGTVGSPRARCTSTCAARAASASLAGSMPRANAQFALVYSWPQHTRVSPGSAASRSSEASICAGVPSNRRPQPTLNNVSPQNSTPAPW